MRVAVLGGGHGGYAAAADLALAGHRVRLWRRSATELRPVSEGGTITLVAAGRQGAARLERATTDLAEALGGAEVVFVALPAASHEDLAKRLAPRLAEDQVILLAPGTIGSYALARQLSRAGGSLPYAIAETGTLPYLARKTGPATVAVPARAVNLPTGVFPASRAAPTLARLAQLLPVRERADVLDAALTNTGVVLHPSLVLLNAGALDAGPFDVHAAGTTPTVRRLIDAVDAERVAIREAWGYGPPHYEVATYYDEVRAPQGIYGAGARARVIASGLWNEMLTLDHRYVTEDAVLGLTLFESAARTVGVDTPATSGLVGVFGALLGGDFAGRGRALEHLGLGDLTLREIRALLQAGWASPMWPRVMR